MDVDTQPGILSWLTGRRGLDKGELGKALDNVRKELFELYTKIGLVVGGAGIPVEQLPILQNLMRSLRATLEVAPQPGLNQESLMRSEYARLSAALVKNKTQFDAIVNALEVLGVPARSLQSPGRTPLDGLPQNVELPSETESPTKPSPNRDGSLQATPSPSSSTDKAGAEESFIYIPSSWGSDEDAKDESKELSKSASFSATGSDTSSAAVFQRSRTMIIGGSVFFSPARKVSSTPAPTPPPEEKLPPAAISLPSKSTSDGATTQLAQKDGTMVPFSRVENGGGAESDSSDSEKALALLSPTASNRSMDSSPSPRKDILPPSYSPPPPPEPSAAEAFWRVFWGLEPTPPKPPPPPRRREPRVDERAISSRAVYDMFFGDACVDMTVPDRPTILPPAAAGARGGGHTRDLSSSSSSPLFTPPSSSQTATYMPTPGTPPLPPMPPVTSQASPHQHTPSPGHTGPSPRRRPNGVPLPRQRGNLGGGGNGSPLLPLPPRSPRVGIRSPRTSPIQRSARGQLPRSPLASVSSSSGTVGGGSHSRDSIGVESPDQSATSARGEHANGLAEAPDGILSQAGASIESPNSVLPGHGPGWRSPEPLGPATAAQQGPDSLNCESPSHSRSGSSDWSDGGEDDCNVIPTFDGAFGGVLEPPRYDELFANGSPRHERSAGSVLEYKGGSMENEVEENAGMKVAPTGGPASGREERTMSANGSTSESDGGRQPYSVTVR